MNLKVTIFTGWNIIRGLRLFFGIMIVVQGLQQQNYFAIVLGLLFTGMALLNLGCCGAEGCANTNINKKDTIEKNKDVIYEEVV